MAKKKQIKKKKMSEDETDELVNDWISSIDDLRDFFYEHAPEEEGDIFYDRFLEKFQIVVNVFEIMLQQKMIVQDDGRSKEVSGIKEAEELDIEPKTIKGVRNDN